MNRLPLLGLALGGAALGGLGLAAYDRQLSRAHPAPAAPAAMPRATAEPSPAPFDPPPAFEAGAKPAAEPGAAAAPAPQPAPAQAVPTGKAPADHFVIRRILPIKGAIRYGDWHWDEAGVPAGPIVITVDLEARVLSVFRDGYEIGATAVLLGTQDKPTPTGVFPITEKQVQHFSTIYDSAPMPYMQRLTNDGVTIHATNVQNGYASHGCVGVPLPFAKKLFGVTHVGDKVIITRAKQTGLGQSLVG